MGCCANCFGDPFLRYQIENDGGGTGDCSYCNSSSVPLTDPVRLRDYFELVLGVYREEKGGKTLVEWLRVDWGLFDGLDNAHGKELLSEILDDGEIVRKLYQPTVPDDGTSLQRWQSFREELKHENRFFPKRTPDLDRLGDLLKSHLCADPNAIPLALFRARIMDGDAPYACGQMGTPPSELSTHGRANPIGIPYLYLASDTETAVAEIRPHTGENVCVAEVRLVSDPKIADLRNPRKTISPFALSDEHDIAQLRNEIGFLCQLGEELTRPVLPKSAHLEYLPSQYLCEFIKHLGFDGVMYRSSVGRGTNYAIFDGASTEVGIVRRYTVTGVGVVFKEV